jgi:hypothetical protein
MLKYAKMGKELVSIKFISEDIGSKRIKPLQGEG